MRILLLRLLSLALLLSTVRAAEPAAPATPPAPPAKPLFAPTPVVDITGKHDFPDLASITDAAATELKGLCSLEEFRALPEVDRHVYSFDAWPGEKDNLGSKSYTFNFVLGTEGATNAKVAFIPDGGGPGGSHQLTRTKNATTGKSLLVGMGNLDWGGKSVHTFKFNKPVLAFGVVLRSTGDVELRKFYWQAAKDLNGYPLSYTLSDGTVIQLGERDLRGALIKANTDAFIGVIDKTGRGIISLTYTMKGMAGNVAQSIAMVDLAFVTPPKPAVAPVISLKTNCDFENPEAIASTPKPALAGLAPLDAFRFIVANHRYVYDFATWPQAKAELDSNTADFSFDLKGKGEVGEKITVTATDKAGNAKLAQITLKSEDGLPYHVLGGLGDIGKGAWAEQTFKFEKPVWGFGVTYQSTGDLKLERTGEGASAPVSYTLSDGTVVDLGAAGSSGGVISSLGKTFVGLMDKTDKGISSVTIRVQGTVDGAQQVYIGDLAFALAGLPPGDWKLTMADEFDGDKLNPAYWSTGYKFKDVINSEMQGFVPENVKVANGLCTIVVEQRDCRNTDRYGNTGQSQKFASGAFTSYDKFTQTYGYFEARIKMPHYRGAGIWPAFWALPDRGREYPDSKRGSYRSKDFGMGSEIDIFEFMPFWKREEDGLYPIHVGTIWSYGKVTPTDPAPHGYGSYALGNDGWGPAETYYANPDGEFHTYGLYWSPERLIFYLDSKPIFRVRDKTHIPDVPEFFLFNISISGNGWGRTPGKKQPTMAQIIEDMPNAMEIDYFRAYSGTLDEAVPAEPTDIPVIRKYTPPPPEATPPPVIAAKPAPAAPPAAPAPTEVPAAPVNSTISSPAQ